MKNYMMQYDIEKSSHAWRQLPLHGEYQGLPIFFQDQGDRRIYYSPGFVVIVKNDKIRSFEASLTSATSQCGKFSSQLIRHAIRAVDELEDRLLRPFAPVCLTIYLSNQCNLNCSYCFADSRINKFDKVKMNHITTALNLVTRNCQESKKPVTLVFHGGGEPTINIHLIQSTISLTNQLSEQAGLSTFYYLATNGILSKQRAQWIAKHMNLIGLSCDGPSFIQDKQRPHPNGTGSSGLVERTASIFQDSGTRFSVRVTLTPESFIHQEEIADYICRILKPIEIHVEPLYLGGRAGPQMHLDSSYTSKFAEKYLRARQIAGEYGIPWLSSGSRPEEIHGPYCNVLKSVLNLIPGGIATACFKTSTIEEANNSGMSIGHAKRINSIGQFELDQNHIHELKNHIRTTPKWNMCKECFNQYHCAKSCPDQCIFDEKEYSTENDFRCAFQKILGTNAIFESLKKIMHLNQTDQDIVGGLATSRA
jgi:sulfatase maturation enzyme AslB (radical SAM superfamily)